MKRELADCTHGAGELSSSGLRSSKKACEACGGTEDLRICQTCGYVGCCESHAGHDTEHFEATGHPFISPRARGGWLRRQRGWLWCYLCRAYLD